MTFEEFEANVRQWAQERDIYKYSTANAQLLKAKEEDGELCSSYLKGDVSGMIDAVGDVCACLVNAKAMCGESSWVGYGPLPTGSYVALSAKFSSLCATALTSKHKSNVIDFMVEIVKDEACVLNLNFSGCLQAAWDVIKDRRGKMSPNGAFVKEA